MTRLTTETVLIFGFSAVLFFYVDRWLALFIALCAVSAMFPVLDRFAYWRREAVLFGAAWYAAIRFVRNKEFLLDAVCIIALVNVFAVFLQLVGVDPYSFFSFNLMEGTTSGRFTGLLFNENELSALLGVSFMAFLRPRWFAGIPFILVALIFCKSTVGVAAIAVSVCVGLFLKRKLWLAAPVLIVGLAYVLFWDTNISQSGAWRLDYLNIAQNIISDHPWGIGLGHWHLATNQMHAHNDVAQITVETGIVGFGIMAGYVVSFFKRSDVMGAMAMSAILVTSLVSFAWFIPTTALVMATMLSVNDK